VVLSHHILLGYTFLPDPAVLNLETLAQTWHARIGYRLKAPKIFPK
jgi:hypothetical protein